MFHINKKANLSLSTAMSNYINYISDVLADFATSNTFLTEISDLFGYTNDYTALQKSWLEGNFILPTIEIVSSSQINDANGAYSKDEKTIYLSQQLLDSGNTYSITSVLLEEYGHYLDGIFNIEDTTGDEGRIFSALVMGEELSVEELSSIQSEDDTAIVTIDGVQMTIEQSSGINNAPIAVDDPTIVLQFNGDDEGDGEHFATGTFEDLGTNHQLTYEARIKPQQESGQKAIMGEEALLILLILPDNTVGFNISILNHAQHPRKTGYTIDLDQWTHLSFTYSQDDGVYLYANGVLVYEDDLYAQPLLLENEDFNDPSFNFRVGNRWGTGVGNREISHFKGEIEEVRVWNDFRTEAEIQANFDKVLTGNEAELSAYWRFNQGSGSTVNDLTSNGNDGTLIGSPIWTSSFLITTDENTTIDIDVLANDSDPEGDSLTIHSVDDTNTQGSVNINNDATVNYDPDGKFDYLKLGETATDTFEYTITDGELTDTATVTMTIEGVNDAPVIISPTEFEVHANCVILDPIQVNDPDSDSITYRITDGDDSDKFSIDENTGQLTFNNILDYLNPSDRDVNNVYEVEITANDGNLDSAPQLISVTVIEPIVKLEVTVENEILLKEVNPYSAPAQDQPDSVVTNIISGFDGIRLEGNAWKQVDIGPNPYEITSETILKFDYKSNSEGEIQGIGLDNDDSFFNSLNQIFQISGEDILGIQNFNTYAVSNDSDWQEYKIPVGQFFTGEIDRLTFINDDDVDPTSSSEFRDISLTEGDPDITELAIDINNSQFTGQINSHPTQDDLQNSTVSTFDNDQTIEITGNGWKQIMIGEHTITDDTILNFDFFSDSEGEVQGIWIDDDDSIFTSIKQIFQITGVQSLGTNIVNVHEDNENYVVGTSGWQEYTIPLGNIDDLSGATIDRITFISDDDRTNPTGMSSFRNISLTNLS